MVRHVVLGCALLAIGVAGCGQSARVGPAHAELQGTWDVTQIVNNGEPAPGDEIRGMRFVFAGDQLTVSGPDEGPDEFTVTLDPAQVPAAMDLFLVGRETKILAIYKLDRDTLTIAMPPQAAGRRARPTTFVSMRGSELGAITLKRR